MPHYRIHVYRELRLVFESVEAESAEEAAALARDRDTDDADAVEDCNGETFAALVDVVGDEEYEHSRMIDFEGERLRRAAPLLREALAYALEFLEANDDGEQDVTGRIDKARDALVAARAGCVHR